jgi:heme oxygenase
MNVRKPRIRDAWQAFENDLTAKGATPDEIDAAKLVWHSGAAALGIVFVHERNTVDEKFADYQYLLDYMATCGNFPRLAAKMRGKPQ